MTIDASVVICAYTMDRWNELVAAVNSVRVQTRPAREILVVIDNNESLWRRVAREIEGITVIPNTNTPGLSGARMTGAEHAKGSVIVYLDDDAAAADQVWLANLMDVYENTQVLGVGGHIDPKWLNPAPRWFPPEFNWIVGCTYKGMSVKPNGRIRNPIGANMSVRAEVLWKAGGFADKLGRREGRGGSIPGVVAESCEETEFCIRASRLHPGGYWAYCPTARVTHVVPPQRATWAYFVRRCCMEGTAKAVLSGLTGTRDGLSSERNYVVRMARSVLGYLAHGDFARAAVICSGALITAAAYARARRAVSGLPNG